MFKYTVKRCVWASQTYYMYSLLLNFSLHPNNPSTYAFFHVFNAMIVMVIFAILTLDKLGLCLQHGFVSKITLTAETLHPFFALNPGLWLVFLLLRSIDLSWFFCNLGLVNNCSRFSRYCLSFSFMYSSVSGLVKTFEAAVLGFFVVVSLVLTTGFLTTTGMISVRATLILVCLASISTEVALGFHYAYLEKVSLSPTANPAGWVRSR